MRELRQGEGREAAATVAHEEAGSVGDGELAVLVEVGDRHVAADLAGILARRVEAAVAATEENHEAPNPRDHENELAVVVQVHALHRVGAIKRRQAHRLAKTAVAHAGEKIDAEIETI